MLFTVVLVIEIAPIDIDYFGRDFEPVYVGIFVAEVVMIGNDAVYVVVVVGKLYFYSVATHARFLRPRR